MRFTRQTLLCVCRRRLRLILKPANHTGFFVAQSLGFYNDEQLIVHLQDPSSDGYRITPARKLASGDVDFALAPTESILAYRFSANPVPLTAVAAVLAQDCSSIAVLRSSEVKQPKDLDGKRYASYGARFEDHIVQEMIKSNGGNGSIDILHPPKLGIWDTIMTGEADATWGFDSWEGVEAKLKGVDLRYFKLGDYGIPYGYSPILLVNERTVPSSSVVRRFLRATKRGFAYAIEQPDAAAEILQQYVPSETPEGLVSASQRKLAGEGKYGPSHDWGRMSETQWEAWVNWLTSKQLFEGPDAAPLSSVDVDSLFTNEFLE